MCVLLLDAKLRLLDVKDKAFGDIPVIKDKHLCKMDKGTAGKAIEAYLGLNNSAKGNDFEDGELKTVRVDHKNVLCADIPFVTLRQTNARLITPHPFEESALYARMQNTLIVPVYHPLEDPRTWIVRAPWHLCLQAPGQAKIRATLTDDYRRLINQLVNRLEEGKLLDITLSAGFLSLRPKDSKNPTTGEYRPVVSANYARRISEKDYAFYLDRECVRLLRFIT
jgi:DNA mismatch repair protein MutH